MRRRISTPSGASNRSLRLWSDNLVLIPASQLPFKDEWNRIAHGLPAGEALFVVPEKETPLKQAARALVPQLRAKGRHVTAITARHIGADSRRHLSA